MTGPVIHGGATPEERARLTACGIPLVDLSANINPYGPHARVVRAARRAPIDRYPDPSAASLREAYAAAHGLSPASVLAGNGSSELLYLACHAFAGPGRPVLIAGPTFGEYAAAAAACDAPVVRCDARVPDFRPDLDQCLGIIAASRPSLVVVCNPNNPTGALMPPSAIEQLTEAVRAVGGRLLVDEAYVDFAPPGSSVGPAPGRFVVRSLTKLHAIPGLRAGVLLGTPEDVATIEELQPPWPVSAPALAASLQALKERRFAATSRARLSRARTALVAGLEAVGFRCVPTAANFVLVHVGDGAAFRARVLAHGFALRDCTSFGLPEYVRVAVPREEMVDRILQAMEASR